MPRGESNRKLSVEQWSQVVKEYQTPQPDGAWLGATSLARKYGVSQGAIYYHLRRAGVASRSAKEAYAHGKQCKPITRLPDPNEQPPLCKCGCGEPVTWNRNHDEWHTYVSGHYRPKQAYHDYDWLVGEYVGAQRTMENIAAEFGVAVSSIAKSLDKHGIMRRPQSESLRISGAVAGANNPAWQGGVTPERQRLYKQGHWREFAQSIYERDGFHCQRCGAPKKSPKGLHAHHIKPWADNPALRFDPDNLVTLCRKCHTWVHSLANVDGEFLD